MPKRFSSTPAFDPHTAIARRIGRAAIARADPGMDRADRDEWLNLLLATRVEPQLGRDRPEIIYHYPAIASVAWPKSIPTPAATKSPSDSSSITAASNWPTASTSWAMPPNCAAASKPSTRPASPTAAAALPLPESLLAAMEHGLPDCTGVRARLRPAGDAGGRCHVDRRRDRVSARANVDAVHGKLTA